MSYGVLLFVYATSALLYTYMVYPALLLIGRRTTQPVIKGFSGSLPTVSVIIPFHNEKRWVRQKLENTLQLEYPAERLQVIAVSDGSSDGTEEILKQYRDRIHVISYRPRQGKPTALNTGALQASGDILLFSDANVMVNSDALRILVRQYGDPSIGGVCGNVALQAEGAHEPLGEGIYMRYERWLYNQESRAFTMVGADGALFSIRRSLFTPLPADTITDDFDVALSIVAQRRRLVYEAAARATEVVVPDVKAEFRRKVRMIAGGYQTLWRHNILLNPFRHPVVAWQLISHKLLRWLVPVLLVTTFLTAFAERQYPVMAVALVLQMVFYCLAFCGWISQRLRRWMPVYVPYYFCAVNVAAAIGLWRYLIGQQSVLWQKVSR